ncbi:putative transposase DNA-binding domain-containing protein [Lipomyces kononenkoae]
MVLQQAISETTSTGNGQTSDSGSRKRNLHPTFEDDSVRPRKTFWTEATREISQEWPLVSGSSVSGSSRNVESDSWFPIQVHPQTSAPAPISQKSFLPSLLTQQSADCDGHKMRALKIRLFPTKSQKETLRQWFGTQQLRAVLLNSETNKLDDTEKWLEEYEYDLKDEAIRDFMKNYSSNMAKYKNTKKPFTLKFRSKYAPTQNLSVLKKKWNRKLGFYSSIFSPSNMAAAEQLPTKLERDSRLLRTLSGKYFLVRPSVAKKDRGRAPTRGSFVFIDPGVRTFLTCYDSDANVVEVGKDAVVRVSKLLHRRRRLQSRLAALRVHKKRQNLQKAYIRLGERIIHLVEDMHKKAAVFLCANYEAVFLPKLNFHGCRNLNKKSKASMATLRHCAFFDRAVMKAELSEQTQVVEVNEEWTSKTCSSCGWVNHKLGRSKVFECARCTSVFDRDFNACKNIMLKYFTEQSAR